MCATLPAVSSHASIDQDAWFQGGKQAAFRQALALVERTLAGVRGVAGAWAAKELASEDEVAGIEYACKAFAEVAATLASQTN